MQHSDRWQEALRRLKDAKDVVVDLETTGLDWRKNAICGWVLTFGPAPQDSYYLAVRHKAGGNILDWAGPQTADGWDGSLHPIETELIVGLDQQDKSLTFHNGAFDLRFAWRLGMKKLQARFFDTIINAALLDEWQPKFSLEYCCEQAGVAAKKSALITEYLCSKFPEAAANPRQAMGFFWQLSGDDPVAIDYATGDGTSTFQLRDWQMTQLTKPLPDHFNVPDNCRTLERVHDVESRLIPVLARMSGVGIKIDEEYLDFLLSDKPGGISQQIDKLQAEFPQDFNFRSPNDVQKWCVDKGVLNWPFTPGRMNKQPGRRVPQPSFPGEWLKLHPETKKISTVRKLLTLRDTFMKPMKETHLWKGRVHTVFHQLGDGEFGTPTGRLSASAPNLQAVTKHEWEIGKLHRRVFIPDESKRWANADFSQIEPRLLAYYAGIKILLEGFRAVPYVDAHTSVSAQMNSNWPNMSKDERKHYRDKYGKRINQTVLTGGGKSVIVSKYGVPVAEVDEAWDKYHAAMPELKPWQKSVARNLKRRGLVVTLLGRRCRMGPDGRDYIGPNRLLQGGNADLIKTKLVQIDEYLASEGRPLDVLNNIHDDIAFQFDEGARRVYNRCLEIMVDVSPGQPIELDVPMAVDTGEGSSWSEATYDGH